MTAQGLEVMESSVQLSHAWINELAARLGWGSKRSTLRLLRVVLARIRDHLSPDELAQFSAQLPVMLRGFLFEGWMPRRTPIRERRAGQFITFVTEMVQGSEEYRGQPDIICVFDLLNARISRGEIAQIRACLPQGVRALWPEP